MSTIAARPVRFAAFGAMSVALAALSLVIVGPSAALIPLLYLAVTSPALAATDVAERRLPNRLVLPGYGFAAAALVIGWVMTGEPPTVAVLAGGATFAFLFVLAAIGGMGMGDVKLGGLLGLVAGALSLSSALLWPLLAFVLGGVGGVVALRMSNGVARATIPFGPFLLAGFWLAVAWEPATADLAPV